MECRHCHCHRCRRPSFTFWFINLLHFVWLHKPNISFRSFTANVIYTIFQFSNDLSLFYFISLYLFFSVKSIFAIVVAAVFFFLFLWANCWMSCCFFRIFFFCTFLQSDNKHCEYKTVSRNTQVIDSSRHWTFEILCQGIPNKFFFSFSSFFSYCFGKFYEKTFFVRCYINSSLKRVAKIIVFKIDNNYMKWHSTRLKCLKHLWLSLRFAFLFVLLSWIAQSHTKYHINNLTRQLNKQVVKTINLVIMALSECALQTTSNPTPPPLPLEWNSVWINRY